VALKELSLLVVSGFVAVGCSRSAAPAVQTEEPEVLSVTRWTEKTELFAEYPPLVVGATSRFAIHLTRLETFKALTEGRVEVRLLGGARDEIFKVDAPSRPGIFGVDVKPAQAGKRQLVIAIHGRALDDQHRVGEVDVHPNAQAARAAPGAESDEAPGISFLKEQQWSLDFGTAVVIEQALRESIRVPARLEATPEGAADVVAPIDGRLTSVTNLSLGAAVNRGQELARLLPPPSVPGDLPQLQRARAEAQSQLLLAVRDRERAERLTSAGAAPSRRLDDARTTEEQAKARLTAAEASLAHYNAARSGGSANAEGLFVVRAPLAGVIAERQAAAGTNVTAGDALFRVVDAVDVLVVGEIPEGAANRARAARSAEMGVPGRGDRVPVGRRVGIGKVLERESRTLPITFALDNRSFRRPPLWTMPDGPSCSFSAPARPSNVVR
jgi:cobalt-zinc-cadmium efflux system membrane fusion protein